MLRFLIGLSFCLVLLPVQAQVSMDITLGQAQYLPGESVIATIRVNNQSGQAIELGGQDEWLSFIIESKDGLPVHKISALPSAEKFKIESSESARIKVDLAPCYDLTKLGQYTVTASARIPQWNQQVVSKPDAFTVVRGTVLWEQEFGVPAPPPEAGGNAQPEVRKYALMQANFKKQLQLYVRVTDAGGDKTLKVFPIGLLVSFGKPEKQIDRFSNLHILHQIGARSFSYVVVNPDGRIFVRETHDITASRPRLRADQDGRIIVSGGARRVTSKDLPASGESDSKAEK